MTCLLSRSSGHPRYRRPFRGSAMADFQYSLHYCHDTDIRASLIPPTVYASLGAHVLAPTSSLLVRILCQPAHPYNSGAAAILAQGDDAPKSPRPGILEVGTWTLHLEASHRSSPRKQCRHRRVVFFGGQMQYLLLLCRMAWSPLYGANGASSHAANKETLTVQGNPPGPRVLLLLLKIGRVYDRVSTRTLFKVTAMGPVRERPIPCPFI